MPEFKSLQPSGLAEDFDADVHGEAPFVEMLEETDERIRISYVFPGFTVSKSETDVDGDKKIFSEVGISGAGWLSESGKPLLPSFGRYVKIPPGTTYDVKVKTGDAITWADVLITPAQEEAIDGEEHELEYDASAYAEDAFYPSNHVWVDGPFEIDDYRALLVHVRPLRYNPAKRELVGHSNIVVAIELSPEEEDDEEGWPFTDQAIDRRAYGNLFVNPIRFPWRPPLKPLPSRSLTPEFLIIHAKQFKAPAKKLARWKIKKGIGTLTVSIDRVGNSVSEIKAYIRNMRRQVASRLRYVLLFGDVDHITSETVDTKCTDHYYFTPHDPSGPQFVFAWVAGGRIPVRDVQQANAVVNQIIRYERTPPADSSYYNRFALAAYFQDDSPQNGQADRAYMKTMEGIRNHLVSLGKDVDRIYVSNNPNPVKYRDGTTVPADVKASIVDNATATRMLIEGTTEGQLIVGHRDHGGPSGWLHPSFESSDLDSVTGAVPSIFYSVNCQTGRFDSTSPSECFAEAMLAKNGGAPSLVAATRNSNTWRNDSLTKAMFDAMFPGVLPTFPASTAAYPVKNNRLGDILNYGMSYLPIAHSGTSGNKTHSEIYHVVGDPTLELWSHPPLRIRIRAWVRRWTLYVRFSASPADGYLSVWAGQKLLKSMRPRSTQVTLPLRSVLLSKTWKTLPVLKRYLTVDFSKSGYRFVSLRVRV